MTIAVAAIIVLAGALVRGYTGFGASMFWVASLSLIYAPSSVVPTVLALEVLASLVLLPSVIRQVQWGSMTWLLAATVVTMPFGIVLLHVVPDRPMRVVVGLSILAATFAVGFGANLNRNPGRGSALLAGSVSGVVNGATGIGGPPAVLLYFSGPAADAVGRATLIAYFLGTDAIGFAMMGATNLVDATVLWHTLLFAPLALVGIAVGQHAFHHSDGSNFRKVVLVVLALLSVTMLVKAIAFG